jgi:hypothetical protein
LATSPAPFEVFDRSAKRKQRDRAATRADSETGEVGAKSRVTDYLKNEVAERMFERFEVGPPSISEVSFFFSKVGLVWLVSQCE